MTAPLRRWSFSLRMMLIILTVAALQVPAVERVIDGTTDVVVDLIVETGGDRLSVGNIASTARCSS